MFSIRFKITAITIIAILTSILSVVIACHLTIQDENDRNTTEMMSLIGQNTQKSVERNLESIEQSVEMAANIASDSMDSRVLIENGADENAGTEGEKNYQTAAQKARLDSYMTDYCAKLQTDCASIASFTHGVIAYYYCVNPKISEKEHGFYYSRVGKTGFDEQEPLDARKLDPDDIEHTAWYYTPIERGRPSWVSPYTSRFLEGMWITSYLVPIYKSGTLIGVLGMDIPMKTLIEQVSDIRVYDSGFACLLDEEGRIICHPELEAGSTPDISGNADSIEVFRQETSGEELIDYTANGQERQMYFSTLSNGMKLVIAAPVSEITASWTHLTRIIMVDAAVIILVFALLTLLAMGLITRPLKRLTAASQRLADGDYDVELDYTGGDELGTLTKAFIQMRDHLKEYIADLNRRIHTDPLTGMPNMRYFFRLAEKERQVLREEGKTPVLLYFNLIGMKDFNRQYGFDTGDSLLCEVAKILSRHYGEQRLSRFGRDHFVAITDGSHPEEELEMIIREIQDANGGRSRPIQVGIYRDEADDVKTSEACDRAKFACDQLSGTYVSGYLWFDDTMHDQIRDNRYFTSHLDQALEEKWIRVYYQPIVSAASGEVCEQESLSRWIDPKRGMQSPEKFIPILESARLIHRLDLYVLEQILKKIKKQKAAGQKVLPHSLNLSREDFASCDIVEEVCRRVDDAGISRSLLRIEVTESMVGQDFDFMKQQIQRFQSLGFQVWMDDFGSGYSALDVLQDIRFDVIKFDMRFMQRFEEGEESRIILSELLDMASALHIDTIVEGVETEEQAEFLKQVGCTMLQGFYFGKPVPAEEEEEEEKE